MQPPAIRRAEAADAEVLAAIGRTTFTQAFGHLYPPADLARFLDESHGLARARADLADARTAAWLAWRGDEVVGYALAGPCDLPHPEARPADGELKRLYLRDSAQNAGLGGALFEAAMEWLQRDAARTVWIGVWSANHGARRFYERRGFHKVGAYGFAVGNTIDHEFILRRDSVEFSKDGGRSSASRHNSV